MTEQEHFLIELRKETEENHRKLEAAPLSKLLLSEEVSTEDYTRYLHYMREVITYHEQNVIPLIAQYFPDMAQRSKLNAIEEDLRTLPASNQIGETYHPSTTWATVPFAMGYMYVMEGSTLGGRILLKHIKEKLGFDEHNGARFFSGYGDVTGRYWKTFLDIFSRYAIKGNHAQEVIEGAKAAFSSIENYFSRYNP